MGKAENKKSRGKAITVLDKFNEIEQKSMRTGQLRNLFWQAGDAVSTANQLKIESLVAIDTHVHIESEGGHSVNEAARKYFGAKGDVPSGPAIAEPLSVTRRSLTPRRE